MDYRTKIQMIKSEFMAGAITYDEAKLRVQPLLDEMNAKAKVISKKHGFRHKPLTFSYVFR